MTTDGEEEWLQWNGSYETAQEAAAKLVATGKDVDFVLVIDGKAPKQAVAMKRHILAEFNREQRPGTKLYKVKV